MVGGDWKKMKICEYENSNGNWMQVEIGSN